MWERIKNIKHWLKPRVTFARSIMSMPYRVAAAILFVEAPFLTLLGTVLLLITLNQLDLDLGLYYVMWAPVVERTVDRFAVFLNGLGAGLLYATLAYLSYLIRARHDPSAIQNRLKLFICLVFPYVFVTLLTFPFAHLFPTTPYREWFAFGLLTALAVFWGIVVVVTVSSPDQQFDLLLPAGTKSHVVTFAEPPAAFAPDDVTSLTDSKGNPVGGVFTVNPLSPTQFQLIFPAPIPASGWYRFSLAARLPTALLPAAVTPMLAAGATYHTVTFSTTPAAFTAANIASVMDPYGVPVTLAAANAVERLSPTAYRITFLNPLAVAGRYQIQFASNLPGVVGTASVTTPLAANTTSYVVTFTAPPPPTFTAADVTGVTDPNGDAVNGPFTVTPVVAPPLAPTQYEIGFAAPRVGEYVVAFSANAAVTPTTCARGFPDDSEADPPIWLQANGLFAAVLFFYCIPVGYSLRDVSPGGPRVFWTPAIIALYSFFTLFLITPRRVWSALSAATPFFNIANQCPAWLREPHQRLAQLMGGAGLLLLGTWVGGHAVVNLGVNLGETVPRLVILAYTVALIGVSGHLAFWRVRASAVRHTATTFLVAMLGVFIGSLVVGYPERGGSIAALVIVSIVQRAWRQAKQPFAGLPGQEPWVSRTLIAVAGLVLVLLVAYLADTTSDGKLPAALSVSLLLGVLAISYVALHFYADWWFYPVIVAAGLLFAFVGSVRPFPHRIEALAEYYRWKDEGDDWEKKGDAAATDKFKDGPPPTFAAGDRPGKPDLDRYSKYHDAHEAALKSRTGTVDREHDRLQLDEGAVLKAWRDGLTAGKPATAGKPPLIIVTTAGGASTSALYTFAVLTHLEERFPGFHRHVRLVTGASGGMLGAAYYRSLMHEWDSHAEVRAEFKNQLHLYLADRGKNLEKDFLSSIVQAMAFKDAPKYLACPIGYTDDRGRRLEKSWQSGLTGALDVDFRTLRDQERTGKYPSLVFSPMMVEDGRPLLISTLDLGDLTRTPADVDRLMPFRAVEFFKLFPEYGWQLQLGTATRMSATFPFLSPPVTIPTLPPRRLVDAGYYDNYGMDIALGWIERGTHLMTPGGNAKRNPRYLLDYTDNVIIVNIRPYLRVDSAGSVLTEAEFAYRDNGVKNGSGKSKRYLPLLSDATEPFTTPLDGGNAARKSGMVARNNNLLALMLRVPHGNLAAFFTQQAMQVIQMIPGISQDPALLPDVKVVTFRGDLTASLNWTLPPEQIEQIRTASKYPFLPPQPDKPDGEDLKQLAEALRPYFP